ncbi:MAG: ABC transporter substrate-binding protein [Actinomycetota bacterium]
MQRRWILRGARRVVAALLALGTACTSDGAGPPRGNGSSPIATPDPGEGGVIRFGILGEAPTLDPYSPLASHLTFALVRPLYRSLYRWDEDGNPVPDLVESIEVNGRRAVVQLVATRWSNGRAIDTRDVRATWRNASPESGFKAVSRLRAIDSNTLELVGSIRNWPRALARLTFVLPRGRPRPGVWSGPFGLTRRTRGLEYVYEPNARWDGRPVLAARIHVFVVERLEILIDLLEEGRLDAAAPPLSVNLDQRLHEVGLESESALGWEIVYLDFSGSALTEEQRFGLYRLIDRRRLERGLVRDQGRLARSLRSGPGRVRAPRLPGGAVPTGAILQLAVPVGDELLEFVQRVLQRDLARSGIRLEMVSIDAATFYGAWRRDDPIDLALRRRVGGPGMPSSERPPDALPLWQTESVLAWRSGVHGLIVNPTVEGPLWNASEWWIE